MQDIVAGIARFLLALVLAALLPVAISPAAQLQWQALPDRERVSLTLLPDEGMAGKVGRIAPTGLLIPFSEVPGNLFVADPPAGARIFQGTKQQGRSLVLLTQTPEFGYMVAKQSPTELIVDFFPNPLGARWKPSAKAPTTEIPPDFAVAPVSPPDAANRMLADDPQHIGKSVTGAPGMDPPPVVPSSGVPGILPTPQTQPPSPEQTPGDQPLALSPSPVAQSASPAPGSPATTAKPPKNTTVILSGTPEYASAAIAATAAPSAADPSAPNAASGAKQGAPADPARTPSAREQSRDSVHAEPVPAPLSPEQRPLLDIRAQTAERSAPLPLPIPIATPVPPSKTAPVQAVPAQTAATPAQTAPAPAPPPTSMETATPQTVQSPPANSSQTIAGSIPPGVGTRTDGLVYGGAVNIGGLDNIPTTSADAQPQTEVQAQATAQPQTGTAKPQAPPPPAQQQENPSQPVAQQPQPSQQQKTPAPAASVAAHDGAAAPGTDNAPAVIYVDKDGNPVPPPPDPKILLPEIRKHLAANEFPQALEKTESLLQHSTLDQAEQEELLHVRAEMLFAINKENLDQHYQDISDATNQAINYNQKSSRNAGALLRLGYLNLRMKNIPEAEARFSMLRRQFPNDDNVPLTYYYWGDYYFQRNELQRAADEFQYMLQHYPNSRYTREGALGLARAFYRLGYYQQSFNVVDYIEKRWERFYIEYPPFLNMMGDVAFRLNNFDYALKHYWLYVNLEPMGNEADIILTRIGDIYSMKGEKKAGKELYNESLRRFPDKDGALVAMIRLAEDSVNDDPSIAGMFSVFDGPFSMAPVEAYRTIIAKHPQSALVPIAEIKLAMWHLWKREFIETLDTIAVFLKKYPQHELAPKANEIALQTFAVLAAESVADGRYGRMRDIWERYPIVHGQEEILPAESRIALGVSYWKDGKPDDALKTVEPFFLGRKVPEYSEMALSLVLSIYLEHDQWRAVREVAKRVDLWELSPESQRQLDYSLALAAENLNESNDAAPIWQKLYDGGTLPDAQMAYVAFFLARDAEKRRELEKAYALGKEALNRLIDYSDRNPNSADLGKIRTQLSSLMDVAETAGRLREALGFANQYLQYLPGDDGERAAVQYRMARIYRKQGNLDAWKTALTDIAAKNPGTVYGQLANSELKAAEIADDAARYSPTGRI
ncbi:MAG: hypothetical protein LBD42_00970 [Desulfovibrio sp.]|jgi:tetratricopeptide (TPR) repeat protein|nr:hypothetical protein [Desulfovibrio sp.]